MYLGFVRPKLKLVLKTKVKTLQILVKNFNSIINFDYSDLTTTILQ